jgi:hypothetical protein
MRVREIFNEVKPIFVRAAIDANGYVSWQQLLELVSK